MKAIDVNIFPQDHVFRARVQSLFSYLSDDKFKGRLILSDPKQVNIVRKKLNLTGLQLDKICNWWAGHHAAKIYSEGSHVIFKFN